MSFTWQEVADVTSWCEVEATRRRAMMMMMMITAAIVWMVMVIVTMIMMMAITMADAYIDAADERSMVMLRC